MNPLMALAGGTLIGWSVTLMLIFNGRVTGISGILNQVLGPLNPQSYWRFLFLLGLLTGGSVMYWAMPSHFINSSGRSFIEILLAGFLVGFGSILGNGCTSGHGICGVSRLSLRSLVATILFILGGAVSVAFVRWVGWSL